MTRLFYTDVPGVTKTQFEAQKSHLIAYQYNDPDDAFRKAWEIAKHGGVPWEIELEDGSTLDRNDIQARLRARPDLRRPPKVR